MKNRAQGRTKCFLVLLNMKLVFLFFSGRIMEYILWLVFFFYMGFFFSYFKYNVFFYLCGFQSHLTRDFKNAVNGSGEGRAFLKWLFQK